MKVSSTRLDRYAVIAACGSGAVGVAVSPLHADIQYFGSEITLSLSGASTSTFDFTSQTISGGGVSWYLAGYRSASASSTLWSSFFGSGFYYSLYSFARMSTTWNASAFAINQGLFNAGDLIDLAAIQSGSSFLTLHSAYRSFYYSRYSYTYYGSFSSSDVWLTSNSSSNGAMSPGQRGFLALGFELDGETVFGWADISLSTDGLSLTVHGWAFEDSGEAIVAGQTEGGDNAVPGLGGLAALACGAAGMRRRRDRVA